VVCRHAWIHGSKPTCLRFAACRSCLIEETTPSRADIRYILSVDFPILDPEVMKHELCTQILHSRYSFVYISQTLATASTINTTQHLTLPRTPKIQNHTHQRHDPSQNPHPPSHHPPHPQHQSQKNPFLQLLRLINPRKSHLRNLPPQKLTQRFPSTPQLINQQPLFLICSLCSKYLSFAFPRQLAKESAPHCPRINTSPIRPCFPINVGSNLTNSRVRGAEKEEMTFLSKLRYQESTSLSTSMTFAEG
jgi:hypothetical protein